ncbi:MAG: DUF748 domain-containing protein, partial [Chthoniobacterales bacterium]|nr:DUF748 domain-containing protein [Chthoniobacterales bacterium]
MIGIGLLIVILLVLVALAPTLIGTPPVRSMIVGRVNNSIPGNIALDDLSLGWMSGMRISGLKVFDEQNALILEVPKFSTDLTLLKAIRGNLELGNTTADINATRVIIDQNGVSNVERAFGLDQPKSDTEKAPKSEEPKSEEPTELPNISGSIAINILGGTIEMPGTLPQAVHLQPGSIKADIKNINEPITKSGELGYRLGDAAPGTITWNGDLDIADNNILDLAKLSGTEDLNVANVNLAPITAFLPKEQKVQLEGIARAALQLRGSGDDASLNGSIDLADLVVGGAPLNGDTYKTKSLSVPIRVSRVASSSGGSKVRIESLGAKSDDFSLDISGEVPETAMQNLAALKPPGDTGEIAVKLQVPGLANLVNQLPNTFKLAEGVKISEGVLNTTAQIALKPESAAIAYDFAVSGNGTRDGKPVTLAPITLNLNGNVIPLGAEKVPQVSDVTLALKSNFANADGSAKSIEAINLNLGFDLAAMQKELGQFIEFTDLELNGTGKLALATKGDVTQMAQPIATTLDLNLQKLTVRRPNIPGGAQDALANEDIRAQVVAAITLPEAGGYQADAQALSVT